MRRAFLIWPFVLILGTLSALADARISVLVDVLKLDEAAQILSDEGIDSAQGLNAEMLNGQGGPGFALQVEQIYDPARLAEMVRAELEAGLSAAAVEEVIAFYATPLGTQIIDLENAARRAIQETQIEDAARARYAEMLDRDDPRLALITALIDGGDMITRNVTSAMNSNFQFFRGLADGDAVEMTEQEMLDDASKDIEAEMEETTIWLSGYMLLAYSPLSDDELRAYIGFSETPAGQAMNRALFSGFGKAYEDISYGLGRAVALNMTAEEL
jgi:hypothetical protein